MNHQKGEALKVCFDDGSEFEFHRANVNPVCGNNGLLVHCDLEDYSTRKSRLSFAMGMVIC